MTREEAKQLLPVIQAYAEGKTIQFMNSQGRWENIEKASLMFTEGARRYRLKPQPREWFVRFRKGELVGIFETNASYSDTGCEVIRVREVMDE